MNTLSNENATGVNDEGVHANRPLKYLTASSVIGDKVHNNKGEHLGEIEDVMIDILTGRIEYFCYQSWWISHHQRKAFCNPV